MENGNREFNKLVGGLFTPKQMIELVEIAEKEEGKSHIVTNLFKRAAVINMLIELKVNTHEFKSPNSKRYYTELYINYNMMIDDLNRPDMCLFISKKDSKEPDSMFIRIYDEHKDTLLDIIDKSSSLPVAN